MTHEMAYANFCHACGGITDATVVDTEHPERWIQDVRNWTRRKTPPDLRLVTVESVRKGEFCSCFASNVRQKANEMAERRGLQ